MPQIRQIDQIYYHGDKKIELYTFDIRDEIHHLPPINEIGMLKNKDYYNN